MNHVGLTHVGINAGMVPARSYYTVRGRTCMNGYVKFKVSGIVSIAVHAYIQCLAVMYAANFYTLYSVRSKLAAPVNAVYSCLGKHQTETRLNYACSASLANIVSTVYAVKSILFGGVLYGYKTVGHISVLYSELYHCIADLHGIYHFFYKCMGRRDFVGKTLYAVKSCVGTAGQTMYAVKSSLSTVKYSAYKTTASLKNTIGAWYYRCTGGVKLMAYITSVPHRIQEFVTNKRWFRNG